MKTKDRQSGTILWVNDNWGGSYDKEKTWTIGYCREEPAYVLMRLIRDYGVGEYRGHDISYISTRALEREKFDGDGTLCISHVTDGRQVDCFGHHEPPAGTSITGRIRDLLPLIKNYRRKIPLSDHEVCETFELKRTYAMPHDLSKLHAKDLARLLREMEK